jgi:hypothetical protein
LIAKLLTRARAWAARRPAKVQRIVQLHEKNKRDAAVGIDHAQRGADGVQRLRDDEAPLDGADDLRGDVRARQRRTFGVAPAQIKLRSA